MAGSIPTVSFLAAWTKFRTNPSDDIIVELSRSINVSSKLFSNLRISKVKTVIISISSRYDFLYMEIT